MEIIFDDSKGYDYYDTYITTVANVSEESNINIIDKKELTKESVVKYYILLLPTSKENRNGYHFYYLITHDWKKRMQID